MTKDEQYVLDTIYNLTNILNQGGRDIPYYCRVDDFINNVDMSEKEAIYLAIDNGYKVYRVFPKGEIPGEFIIGGEGFDENSIKRLYKEEYGIVPTIKRFVSQPLLVESAKEDIPFNYIKDEKVREVVSISVDIINDYLEEVNMEIEGPSEISKKVKSGYVKLRFNLGEFEEKFNSQKNRREIRKLDTKNVDSQEEYISEDLFESNILQPMIAEMRKTFKDLKIRVHLSTKQLTWDIINHNIYIRIPYSNLQ